MKVVLVGTSLGNSFFASAARKHGASVTFFESSHLGGAWGQAPLNGEEAPRFNNIVFPNSPSQEEKIIPFFEWLIERGAKVELVQDNFDVSTSFKPTKIIAGNFAGPVISVSKFPECVVEPEPVRTIDVYESRVVVNHRDFDYAVFPLNAKVESLRFYREDKGLIPMSLEWESSRSQHLRALYDFPIEGKVFAENRDDVFDRFGVIPGGLSLFIGRVARHWKGNPPEILMAKSSITSGFAPNIVAFDLQRYEQNRMSPIQSKYLRSTAMGSRLIVLDSSDVISSIQNAEAALSWIFRRPFSL